MKLFVETRSVTILGATQQALHHVQTTARLLGGGFAGRLYPVNPHAQDPRISRG